MTFFEIFLCIIFIIVLEGKFNIFRNCGTWEQDYNNLDKEFNEYKQGDMRYALGKKLGMIRQSITSLRYKTLADIPSKAELDENLKQIYKYEELSASFKKLAISLDVDPDISVFDDGVEELSKLSRKWVNIIDRERKVDVLLGNGKDEESQSNGQISDN